jgi:hypothetical protein
MDREAEFRRLYEAHRAAVHAYFTGRTGDPQWAADLMQDVFLPARPPQPASTAVIAAERVAVVGEAIRRRFHRTDGLQYPPGTTCSLIGSGLSGPDYPVRPAVVAELLS